MRNSSDYDDDEDRDHHEAPRSSNKSLLIILGVIAGILCVCLVVCGGLFYLGMQAFKSGMGSLQTFAAQAQQAMQDVQAAQTVADSFMQDVAGGRLDGAYARTATEYQAAKPLPQFRAFVNNNPALKNYQPGSFLQNTNYSATSITFQGNLPAPNGPMVTFTLRLAKEGTAWKIDLFTIPQQ